MQNKTTTKRSKNDDEETQIITGMKNCKKILQRDTKRPQKDEKLLRTRC